MSEYYLLRQNKQLPGVPVIEDYPEYIDILDFISGKKLNDIESPVVITLSDDSGDVWPDMLTYLLPLVSDRLKTIFEKLKIDNIEYYPVKLIDSDKKEIGTKYWLANVIGLIECIDESKSDTEIHPISENLFIKTFFAIDEEKAHGQKLFRLREEKTFIIIHETVKEQLEPLNLVGVEIINTKKYKGY